MVARIKKGGKKLEKQERQSSENKSGETAMKTAKLKHTK